MEVFSLLKFWRNAHGNATGLESSTTDTGLSETYSSISSAVNGENCPAQEQDTDDDDSYFELVFTAPDCYNKDADGYSMSTRKDGDLKLDFVESQKEVFCKRRIVPIEPTQKPLSPISLLKSPPDFRVFALGFSKSRFGKTEKKREMSQRFAFKCKTKEFSSTPVLTGDNSLRSKMQTEDQPPPRDKNCAGSTNLGSNKRFSKIGVGKYLKLIKPVYYRVSNIRISNGFEVMKTPLSSPVNAPPPVVCSPRTSADEKRGSFPSGLRVVGKHLGKCRSASSAVGMVPLQRRDESLLVQHDGIQSAILHCKRSYSSSKTDCSVQSMFGSDDSKKLFSPSRSSIEEKRSSI